jgi:pimeloyl-[acyl-carrier protein] methyl ester esterase
MSLYFTSTGSGAPIVFLHGWGLNHSVWSATAEHFSQNFCTICADLPGHGKSPLPDNGYTLTDTSQMLTSIINPDTTVIAWSLSGLMAISLVAQSHLQIRKLVLVSSSAQFFASDDWPHGMELSILESFARELQQDYEGTIKRFLSLQSMGSLRAKEEIRYLREALTNSEQKPRPEALVGGLNLLQTTNLRPQCHLIQCPTLIINGERDRIVNPQTGEALSRLIPNSKYVCINDAGHAPFISHKDIFNGHVEQFIHD